MNNKGTKEQVAQKKGFYIALYSILAALLVLAAVISYNNYTAVQKARELRAQIAAEDLQAVGAERVASYLPQEEARTAPTPAPRVTPAPRAVPGTPGVTTTPAPRTAPAPPAQPRTPAQEAQPAPATQPQPAPNPAAAPAPAQGSAPIPSPSPPPARSSTGTRTSAALPPVIETFTEGDSMNWPVLGEIVMDFSSDSLVYDRTLEQFRTNDVMCISTEIGTPVRAATGGVVKSVLHSRELGNTVVLDHGNGWATSYSQLQDGVLVKAGDVVNSGQVIGGVGAPTLYYVLLGNHLGFAVAHNDSFLDPKMLLE